LRFEIFFKRLGKRFRTYKVDPEPLHLELFERVWLGIAGILRQEEIDEFRPLATKAFGFEQDDERLRITNGT